MCGIAGFVGPGNASNLRAMADALVHRGPDGSGYYIEEERRVFLAHRRLAILDIGGGEQPMWNEDASICVVFNGEIYNHMDLRRDLVSRGHVFRSDHSDTEVLVHGYEEWGHELPLKLNGAVKRMNGARSGEKGPLVSIRSVGGAVMKNDGQAIRSTRSNTPRRPPANSRRRSCQAA